MRRHTWPGASVAFRASSSCLLLAFCLYDALAAAPTQQVSNVRFEDTNDDGGWLSGTVRWDPPADTTGLKSYAVLIFNSMDNVASALPALPGDFDGAWFLRELEGRVFSDTLVGTNSVTIKNLFDANFPRRGSMDVQPQDRRRYNWSPGTPPDRYLAVACLNDQQESGPPVSILIYDKSTQLPREHLSSVSFTDTAPYLGIIDGMLSWPVTNEGDFTLTQSYAVFLANDELGTNEIQVGSTTVPTWELRVSGYRANRDYIRIRGVNPNGMSSWSLNHRIFDLGPGVPRHGVTALAFIDADPRLGWVAGNVTWTPPEDEAPILSYRLFLSDQPGVGGIVQPVDGYNVPVGYNTFVLPASELRNAAEAGDPDYIQVYAVNDKGMQALPTELAIEDHTEV